MDRLLKSYWDDERKDQFKQEIFLQRGLYEKIEIDGNYNDFLEYFLFDKLDIDVYCPQCKAQRFFVSKARRKNIESKPVYIAVPGIDVSIITDWKHAERLQHIVSRNPFLTRTFNCPKTAEHIVVYTFVLTEKFIMKVGQYPSFLDLNYTDLKDFGKILNEKQLKEYKEALRLHSFGVSVAAFVYLRRIFEDLVRDAAQVMSQEKGICYNELIKQRTADLVGQLKSYLPEFLIEERKLYGIVSSGIHELTEESCHEMFNDIKSAIDIILKDLVEKRERAMTEKETKKALNKFEKGIKEGTIK